MSRINTIRGDRDIAKRTVAVLRTRLAEAEAVIRKQHGRAITTWRCSRHFTIRELSEAVGVRPIVISDIEQARRPVSNLAGPIADALRVARGHIEDPEYFATAYLPWEGCDA